MDKRETLVKKNNFMKKTDLSSEKSIDKITNDKMT
jgi:hypothetical protein